MGGGIGRDNCILSKLHIESKLLYIFSNLMLTNCIVIQILEQTSQVPASLVIPDQDSQMLRSKSQLDVNNNNFLR